MASDFASKRQKMGHELMIFHPKSINEVANLHLGHVILDPNLNI
jgi:hypothetical protein